MQGHHIPWLGFTQAFEPFLDPSQGFAERDGQLMLCPAGMLLCVPAQTRSLHNQLGFGQGKGIRIVMDRGMDFPDSFFGERIVSVNCFEEVFGLSLELFKIRP